MTEGGQGMTKRGKGQGGRECQREGVGMVGEKESGLEYSVIDGSSC